MLRIFGHFVARNLVLLCAGEVALCTVGMLIALASIDHRWPISLQLDPALFGQAIICAVVLSSASMTFGLYDPSEKHSLLLKIAAAAALALPLIAVAQIIPWLSRASETGFALWLISVSAAWLLCLMITRGVFGLALRSRVLSRRMVIVGPANEATRIIRFIEAERGLSLEVTRVIEPQARTLEQLHQELDPALLKRGGVSGIIVLAEDRASVDPAMVLACKLAGITVWDQDRFWEEGQRRIRIESLNTSRLLVDDGYSFNRGMDIVKRLCDIVVAVVLLIFTLPLAVLISVLIRCDSPGPIFYPQTRVGLRGRKFTLLKFRSMCQHAEAQSGPRWASERDDRITRIGRFIRYARIDELPQLINVIRGDMSMIGPRPERPYFVDQLTATFPLYELRHAVKPGITGWAQINYPYGASMEDAVKKLSYDFYYIKRRTLFLDLIILLSTIRVVLFQEGAR